MNEAQHLARRRPTRRAFLLLMWGEGGVPQYGHVVVILDTISPFPVLILEIFQTISRPRNSNITATMYCTHSHETYILRPGQRHRYRFQPKTQSAARNLVRQTGPASHQQHNFGPSLQLLPLSFFHEVVNTASRQHIISSSFVVSSGYSHRQASVPLPAYSMQTPNAPHPKEP